MNEQEQLREHVLELLEGKSAHIDIESGLNGFPIEHINTRIENSPHTPWELLEHLRIAQWDILDFCTNPNYKEMKWPDDYWVKPDGSSEDWQRSVQQIFSDLQSMRDLVADGKNDLYAKIAHGNGQTILREALLVADHNAYHLGQLVLLRRIVEKS
jgi:hypothetical protein